MNYGIKEIKDIIDFAIQKTMYETHDTKDEHWDVILQVQTALYEGFGI